MSLVVVVVVGGGVAAAAAAATAGLLFSLCYNITTTVCVQSTGHRLLVRVRRSGFVVTALNWLASPSTRCVRFSLTSDLRVIVCVSWEVMGRWVLRTFEFVPYLPCGAPTPERKQQQ